MHITIDEDHRSTMYVSPDQASVLQLSRLLAGLAVLTIGIVGALRTFDAVQLSAIHLAFLTVTIFGAGVMAPSLAIARR